ncbi:MAG: ATP-binding protein [Clostridia bacterium]|nr:ATP-binding protein [Clostridia bacterium]
MSKVPAVALYAKELKLSTFVDCQPVIRQATAEGWGYEEFLGEMLSREAASRKERQVQRRIKLARFPFQKTLEEFKFEALPHVEEAQVLELSAGEFIKRRENVVMIGNPGTGKSHLSIALGIKACIHGYSTRFFTAANLVTRLCEAQTEKKLGRMLKELAKVNLLIVDELSYVSFPRPDAELLFQVIAERSERGSVIINTNLDFSKWEEIFGDHMLAAALVDRLTFKSHILNMNAESYRLKQHQRTRAG